MILIRSSASTDNVLRLQIAVHHSLAVHVLQGDADFHGDPNRAIDRKLPLLCKDLAEQAPVRPLGGHIKPLAAIVMQNLDHRGMIEFLADFGFAIEAVVENRVSLGLRVRHLKSDGLACAQIAGAKNGGHTARSHHAFDLVMVDLVPRVELLHAPIVDQRS